MKRLAWLVAFLAGLFASGSAVAAEDRFAAVEVIAQPVAGSVYMLRGAGGNVGASIGTDGTLLVDDDYAPMSGRLLGAITELGGARPKLVLNTHVHGDHVGGNGFFGDAVIFAHENVRVRLVEGGIESPALPVLTYQDRVRLYFNDDEIDIVHVPRGHTDGDSIVWFKRANVMHMGDQFWNGLFPRIDIEAGGSVDGYLANIELALEMIDERTRVIPGHGELGDRADLAAAADMIRETRALVDQAVAEGQLAQLLERGLGERWQSWGAWFIKEETWIRALAAASAD